MFFISKDWKDGTYDVTDAVDGVVERVSLSSIKEYIRNGVEIKGVSKEGRVTCVFPTMRDYIIWVIFRKQLSNENVENGVKLDFGKFSVTAKPHECVLDFVDLTDLVSFKVPDFVTAIGDFAFESSKYLRTVEIPDSVTRIGFYSFSDCHALEEVTGMRCVVDIGSGAFNCCSNLRSIVVSEFLQTVGDEAFNNCGMLKRIDFTEHFEYVGEAAFFDSGLEVLDFSKSTDIVIGFQAIDQCMCLTELRLPAKVTGVTDDFCFGCGSLKKIYIPLGAEALKQELECMYICKDGSTEIVEC